MTPTRGSSLDTVAETTATVIRLELERWTRALRDQLARMHRVRP